MKRFTTDMDISPIAYMSGYNSYPHFCTQFKRIMKMSPTPYHGKKYRWDVVRMDRDEHVQFGDALQEIYLEMQKFQLPLRECKTLAERFLYVLKNMEILV
ncbi:MAG: AraC family transcriptional regulator [Parabacteroides sp.]|nr:AraC family transcriptional regulator [Parabacteroides sp.]